MGGKGYKSYTSLTGKKVSGDWEDSDRGAGNRATRRAGGEVKAKSPTYIAHVINKGKKKVDPKKNPAVKEHHQTDANGKVIEHGDGTPSSVEEAKKKGLDGKECWDGYKLAGTKKKGGKTVDNCVKVDEAKVEAGRSDYGKASVRNKRRFGKEGEPAIFDASGERGKMIDQRRAEHKAKRGVKEEVDAYKYVVSKLKKKYGSGVLTKGDKIKPQSAADKAKARAHQAKVDAENAAERAKDPSQGRYPKGYSNRGSD